MLHVHRWMMTDNTKLVNRVFKIRNLILTVKPPQPTEVCFRAAGLAFCNLGFAKANLLWSQRLKRSNTATHSSGRCLHFELLKYLLKLISIGTACSKHILSPIFASSPATFCLSEERIDSTNFPQTLFKETSILIFSKQQKVSSQNNNT
jgi:hypothetical protein